LHTNQLCLGGFTVALIATIHKGTRSPQDAPQRHAKGAARVEARGDGNAPERNVEPRRAHTSSATHFSGQHDADREAKPSRDPAERQPTMKKLVAIRSQARALTQPPRKSPPAKAPPPSKAEKGFLQAAAFKRKFPLLASTPSAKRKARQAATAYGAELSRKGGKR
jgi:hypothetical protein